MKSRRSVVCGPWEIGKTYGKQTRREHVLRPPDFIPTKTTHHQTVWGWELALGLHDRAGAYTERPWAKKDFALIPNSSDGKKMSLTSGLGADSC